MKYLLSELKKNKDNKVIADLIKKIIEFKKQGCKMCEKCGTEKDENIEFESIGMGFNGINTLHVEVEGNDIHVGYQCQVCGNTWGVQND